MEIRCGYRAKFWYCCITDDMHAQRAVYNEITMQPTPLWCAKYLSSAILPLKINIKRQS